MTFSLDVSSFSTSLLSASTCVSRSSAARLACSLASSWAAIDITCFSLAVSAAALIFSFSSSRSADARIFFSASVSFVSAASLCASASRRATSASSFSCTLASTSCARFNSAFSLRVRSLPWDATASSSSAAFSRTSRSLALSSSRTSLRSSSLSSSAATVASFSRPRQASCFRACPSRISVSTGRRVRQEMLMVTLPFRLRTPSLGRDSGTSTSRDPLCAKNGAMLSSPLPQRSSLPYSSASQTATFTVSGCFATKKFIVSFHTGLRLSSTVPVRSEISPTVTTQ
mmetsp:Transcript_6007/g.12871  ORF Transcript_6007/g.12871 Transcript_6007/m.12871 type:complete len:286 (+) Transcript_6007:531-1388(+)